MVITVGGRPADRVCNTHGTVVEIAFLVYLSLLCLRTQVRLASCESRKATRSFDDH